MSKENYSPEYYLIKDFVDWIQKKHFVIMNKGSWDNTSMYHKQEPKPGDITIVNIRFEMKRPSRDEIENWIEIFLKQRKDSENKILG